MLLFSKIEGPRLEEYYYLEEGDHCLFLREYTAGAGYQESETNQLIFNLKKAMDRRADHWEWRWKVRAIKTCARELSAALSQSSSAQTFTFVPIPPSKGRGDPAHDDRLLRILREVDIDGGLDVRELVVQEKSRETAHASPARRPRPEDHLRNWRINEDLACPEPTRIAVFDDVLTSGSSFRAMQRILGNRFPEARIIGVFMARTLHPEPDGEF